MDHSISILLVLCIGGTLVLLMLDMLAAHVRGVIGVHDLKIRVAELRLERVERIRAMGGMSAVNGDAPANAENERTAHH